MVSILQSLTEDQEFLDKRQELFERVDQFLTQKFNSANVIENTDDYNTNTNSSNRNKRKSILQKNLEFKRKPLVFKNMDQINNGIRTQIKNGRYNDLVTQSRERSRKKSAKLSHVEEDHYSESSSESEDDEVEQTDFVESIIYQKTQEQINRQYFLVAKTFRYLKMSDVYGTLISLCTLRELRLKESSSMRAIEDCNGLSVLLNLLSGNDMRCRVGSLKVLKDLSEVNQYCRNITFLGGIEPLIENLREENYDVKSLSAEILARLAIFKRARSNIRRFRGIRYMVSQLDVDLITVERSMSSSKLHKVGRVAQSCVEALWACSKSRRNRACMQKVGVIPLLARLLQSENTHILVPVIGTLQHCASDTHYNVSIRTEGMIPILIKHLSNNLNPWLQVQCALTIFKCAEDPTTRDMVRALGGLECLNELLDFPEDLNLTYAVTGAVWKCCLSLKNVKCFQKLGTTEALAKMLNQYPEKFEKYLPPSVCASEMLKMLEKTEKIIINITGAVAELVKIPEAQMTLHDCNGIEPLIKLLNMPDNTLLVNITKALSLCASDKRNMNTIVSLDGVRLLFSLLKHPDKTVQASAAWAISPVISNASDAGELVRSFVGSIEMVMELLNSIDQDILTATCSAIAEIAKDEENLAVITDHGIVKLLTQLVKVDNDNLRCHLAEAIARCCNWSDNAAKFGEAGAVIPLVNFLRSQDTRVHTAVARALYQLSRDPKNSIEMNHAGVARLLVGMIGSEQDDLQEAAAGAIGNIRRLAYSKEKAKLQRKKML